MFIIYYNVICLLFHAILYCVILWSFTITVIDVKCQLNGKEQLADICHYLWLALI